MFLDFVYFVAFYCAVTDFLHKPDGDNGCREFWQVELVANHGRVKILTALDLGTSLLKCDRICLALHYG